MVDRFAVYGAGGMGKEADWIAESNQSNLELAFFIDDDLNINSCNSKPVLHETPKDLPLVISIAEPVIKSRIVSKLGAKQFYINLIAESAKIHSSAHLGTGCILGFDVVVSCDVKVGHHSLINARSIIGHDSILGDFVSIMYNVSISGNVKIGDGTLIGSGAIILPNITIGKWCKIGSGAVVIKDIPDYSVVVGVPGKIIKTLEAYE
jgi:sugar O-acyltransferase (sialic acid O-acetyltransferase NeuD family)